LLSYLNEWVWKWNHRDDDVAMFRSLLTSRELARPNDLPKRGHDFSLGKQADLCALLGALSLVLRASASELRRRSSAVAP
jgi:hypothetical protein